MNFALAVGITGVIVVLFTSQGLPYQPLFILYMFVTIMIDTNLTKFFVFLCVVGYLIIAYDDTFVKAGYAPPLLLPGSAYVPGLTDFLIRQGISVMAGVACALLYKGQHDEHNRHLASAKVTLEIAQNVSDKLVAFDTKGAQAMLQTAEGQSLTNNQTRLVVVFIGLRTALDSLFKYVPRTIVETLRNNGTLGVLGMDSMHVTISFTDIKGFTTWCTRVDKHKFRCFITTYFEIMTNIVQAYRGVVDKYIGDCIMVMWGAPIEIKRPILRACCAALAMDRATKLEALQALFSLGRGGLTIRTGIHCGECHVGNMGTLSRVNYTVVGDPVNTAARLEAANKDFGTRILISEDAVQTERDGMKELVLRLITNVRLVGREEPLCVFQVIGMMPKEKDNSVGDGQPDAIENLDSLRRHHTLYSLSALRKAQGPPEEEEEEEERLPNGDAQGDAEAPVDAVSRALDCLDAVGEQQRADGIHVVDLGNSDFEAEGGSHGDPREATSPLIPSSNPLQPPPPGEEDARRLGDAQVTSTPEAEEEQEEPRSPRSVNLSRQWNQQFLHLASSIQTLQDGVAPAAREGLSPRSAQRHNTMALLLSHTETGTMRYRFHQWLRVLERNKHASPQQSSHHHGRVDSPTSNALRGVKDIDDTDLLTHARAMCHTASREEVEWAEEFSEAVGCYVQRDFDEALPLLQATLAKARTAADNDILWRMIQDCEGPCEGVLDGEHK